MAKNSRRRKRCIIIFLINFFFIMVAVYFISTSVLFNKFADNVTENISNAIHEKKKVEIKSVSKGKYAYECLSKEEKTVYDEILYTLQNYGAGIEVSTKDENVISKVFEFVLKDYPEIFYTSSYNITTYSIGSTVTKLEVSPIYIMDNEEAQEVKEQVEEEAEAILSGILPDASDYEKVKYVYDYMVENINYNKEARLNQTILSVFLYKESVCQGYSKASQYLLNMLGVESVIVSGQSKDNAHAWNLIKIEDEYYYMDSTWGNTEIFKENSEYVNYKYMCMTSKELLKDHVIDDKLILPECNSTKWDYYRVSGNYYELYDEEAILKAISDAYNRGEGYISIKLGDDEEYNKALYSLFDNEKIFECDGVNQRVYFFKDSTYNILNVFLK
ncbi:Transglutaminase-like superfamily protein [Acetitomaculum ruminis DSM 5522]|uniref:Transglutaminase-like superfamily protein n=1 Tax=Acetitomaculum ruminis DSM 5522 TaxID=1120918 RepID=A0A1I0YJF7_9FIRM|nr:transglutaminase domain-containing protein [Acetitomaculum ruminis]SFB12293.1 Transglutaminase-like superfamily protein [Acetitomaculum ruminis DSM 5522]